MTETTVAAVKKPSPLPVLTQSAYEKMGCPAGYTARYVMGMMSPSSPAADRGTEVHTIISDYLKHLLQDRVSADAEFASALMANASPEAREVLEPFLEEFVFKQENCAGIEHRLYIDEDMQPCPPEKAAYSGQLDAWYLSPDMVRAYIDDWKSYYQIVDADTFQARLYSLLVFCHIPSLQSVRFTLRFPRFGVKAERHVEFTREKMVHLKRVVQRERLRQRSIHEALADGLGAVARPGRQCFACPLLGPKCPVSEWNPHVQMDAEDRIAYAIFLEEAQKANTENLKAAVSVNGPSTYSDANGRTYSADFRLVTKRFYPVAGAVPLLEQWQVESGDPIIDKLTVSGLSGYLKAKKRAALSERLQQVVYERYESHFGVRPVEETEEEEER